MLPFHDSQQFPQKTASAMKSSATSSSRKRGGSEKFKESFSGKQIDFFIQKKQRTVRDNKLVSEVFDGNGKMSCSKSAMNQARSSLRCRVRPLHWRQIRRVRCGRGKPWE
ncbi:hypothetical protein S1OALGB6SA_518 [Olavius algarvensis spirochete endosymbiont]|nr:hypothetical protein S1OALGB6SA_518 [Olavius algarvensis spirochete endosymbiont]